MTKKLLGVGLLLTISNVFAGVFGYIFQIMMGRMLIPSEFALFSAIMSLSAILTSPISAIYTVVSRNITQLFADGYSQFVSTTYLLFNKITLILTLILLSLVVIFEKQFVNLINNSTGIQISLLALIVASSALGMMNNAYLQAGQSFSWLAVIAIATVLIKILLAFSLVLSGFGVNGVLIAVISSSMAAYLIVNRYLKRKYKYSESVIEPRVSARVFNFKKLIPVLIANFSFAVMTQLDIVMVNNFFHPEVAGQYAAAAVLGKAVLYLPGGLVLALYPLVAEAQTKGYGVVGYVLKASLITFILCIAAVIFYWLFGELIVLKIYGERYIGITEYLRYYALAMLPMAMLIVAEYFLLALGKVIYAWLSIIFLPLQVTLILFYHQDIFQIIYIVGMCGFSMLLCGYIYFFRLLRN